MIGIDKMAMPTYLIINSNKLCFKTIMIYRKVSHIITINVIEQANTHDYKWRVGYGTKG